jgi:hypothetical protein
MDRLELMLAEAAAPTRSEWPGDEPPQTDGGWIEPGQGFSRGRWVLLLGVDADAED